MTKANLPIPYTPFTKKVLQAIKAGTWIVLQNYQGSKASKGGLAAAPLRPVILLDRIMSGMAGNVRYFDPVRKATAVWYNLDDIVMILKEVDIPTWSLGEVPATVAFSLPPKTVKVTAVAKPTVKAPSRADAMKKVAEELAKTATTKAAAPVAVPTMEERSWPFKDATLDNAGGKAKKVLTKKQGKKAKELLAKETKKTKKLVKALQCVEPNAKSLKKSDLKPTPVKAAKKSVKKGK